MLLADPADQCRSPQPRFLKLEDVADDLSISFAQAYALVRSGDLAAIKIGGRGQWRVERTALEDFITRTYEQTAKFVQDHPFGAGNDGESPEDAGSAATSARD